MKKQKPARRDIAPYHIQWLLASIAGLLLLAAYLPKKPWSVFLGQAKSWLGRRKQR